MLNGVPIFARGADWIPCDSFVEAIPPQRYQRLLTAARDANMTMLRIWGGGIYEHDVFYETCDRLGLLVWQDFMFACAMYPEDDRLRRRGRRRGALSDPPAAESSLPGALVRQQREPVAA